MLGRYSLIVNELWTNLDISECQYLHHLAFQHSVRTEECYKQDAFLLSLKDTCLHETTY